MTIGVQKEDMAKCSARTHTIGGDGNSGGSSGGGGNDGVAVCTVYAFGEKKDQQHLSIRTE